MEQQHHLRTLAQEHADVVSRLDTLATITAEYTERRLMLEALLDESVDLAVEARATTKAPAETDFELRIAGLALPRSTAVVRFSDGSGAWARLSHDEVGQSVEALKAMVGVERLEDLPFDNSNLSIRYEAGTERCFVGIEAKYTEPFSPKDYDPPQYREVTVGSEWFTDDTTAPERLKQPKANQLWRNVMPASQLKQHGSEGRGSVAVVALSDDSGALTAADLVGAEMAPSHRNRLMSASIESILNATDALSPELSWWTSSLRRRYIDARSPTRRMQPTMRPARDSDGTSPRPPQRRGHLKADRSPSAPLRQRRDRLCVEFVEAAADPGTTLSAAPIERDSLDGKNLRERPHGNRLTLTLRTPSRCRRRRDGFRERGDLG